MTKKKEEIVDQEMTQQVDESVVKELVAKAKEHDNTLSFDDLQNTLPTNVASGDLANQYLEAIEKQGVSILFDNELAQKGLLNTDQSSDTKAKKSSKKAKQPKKEEKSDSELKTDAAEATADEGVAAKSKKSSKKSTKTDESAEAGTREVSDSAQCAGRHSHPQNFCGWDFSGWEPVFQNVVVHRHQLCHRRQG